MLNACEDAVRLVKVASLEGYGHVTERLQSEVRVGECRCESKGRGKGIEGARLEGGTGKG